MDIWAGYIGIYCLGAISGLVAAAVMGAADVSDQRRQIVRGWQPKIIRNKDKRGP